VKAHEACGILFCRFFCKQSEKRASRELCGEQRRGAAERDECAGGYADMMMDIQQSVDCLSLVASSFPAGSNCDDTSFVERFGAVKS
jgi:hypothetical protein